MFLSMTGFGSLIRDFSWGTVSVDLYSINHKYQDFSVKLPKELSALENKITSSMRNLIGRGKVRFEVEITWNQGAVIPVLDEKGILNIFNQVKEISIKNSLKVPDDLSNFLLIPGVFDLNTGMEKIASENPETWDKLINDAINSLIETQKSEGQKMFLAVEKDINIFGEILKRMVDRWTIARDQAIESLRSKIENVIRHYGLDFDEARVAQEVALLSDKWDVSEEIARLEAHTEKFKQFMNFNEPVGKRLDFLLQEMNREVNTMGSKVNDALFRWEIVEAKSCLERMREQIQNIE